jgi:hypothetical protein
MRSTTVTCHPRWLHLFYPYTCEFFVCSHDFDTPDVFSNYMYARYFFSLASRGNGVLIFVFRCYFCTPGRGVWRSREFQRGGYVDLLGLSCFGEKSTLYSRPSRRT